MNAIERVKADSKAERERIEKEIIQLDWEIAILTKENRWINNYLERWDRTGEEKTMQWEQH